MKKPEVKERIPKAGLNLLPITFVLFFIVCYLLPTASHAHKVSVYAYAEDGKVFAEGYFVDGSKAKNSRIEVFDAKTGKKLLEGKTDKDGKFSFKIPEATSFKLIMHASMGHRNDYTISEDEVREAMGISKVEVEPEDEQITESGSQIPEPAGASPAVTQGLSSSEVEAIVDRTIEKKLKPIKNILLQILESLSKPGISEIFGGIGYILGLMGIAMYFKSRRR